MRRCLFIPTLSVLLGCKVLLAQTQAPVPQNGGFSIPPSQSRNDSRLPGDPGWGPDQAHEHFLRKTREVERQRRIVDDASRLVKLTAQYRSDVERHGAVTAEDEKLLLQIEKLAREVKDRMRGM